MSELASAFIRIRPNTTGFKAEAERGVRSGLSGIGKIVGGAFAAVGLEEGVRKVAEAAASQQEELSVVRQAIKSTDSAWVVHGKTVSDTLRETAVKFGFTVSDLAQGFTRIQVSTKDSSKTFSLLDAAMDVSRARHLGLAQAAVVLAKAQSGNVTGLQRLGIVIPKVTAAQDGLKRKHDEAVAAGAKFTKEQELQYKTALAQAKALDAQATKTNVLSEVQARFGGQAANFARTAEGSSQRFHEAVNELEVSVGNGLLPTLTQAAAGATKLFKQLADGGEVQAFAAGTARELAGGYRVVKAVADALVPPLTLVAKGIGEIAHVAGGGGIVAFAIGFKSLSVAIGVAGAARAKWDAIVAQGAGTAAAAAAAEDVESVSLARLTEALAANTVALGGNAVASDAYISSARLRIGTNTALTGSQEVLAGSSLALGAAYDVEAVSAGRLALVGRGLFAAAGGWTTVVAVGLGAAAFGIYKLISAEDSWDAANKRVEASLRLLDTTTQRGLQLRQRLAFLTQQIPTDKLAVAQAKLNEETAKNALLTSKAGRDTEEFRQLQLNLLRAIEDRRSAEKQLSTDQADRSKTSTNLASNDRQNTRAVTEHTAALLARAKAAEKDAAERLRSPPGRIGLNVNESAQAERVQRAAAARFAAQTAKDAETEKNKTIRRNEELVAALARQTGKIPTAKQIRFIIENKDANASLGGILFALDATVTEGKKRAARGGHSIGTDYAHGVASGLLAGEGSIADALIGSLDAATAAGKKHIGAHSPSQLSRDELGKPIVEGVAAGIDDDSDRIGAALKRALSKGVKDGTFALGNVKAAGGRAFVNEFGKDPRIPNLEECVDVRAGQVGHGLSRAGATEVREFWTEHGRQFIAIGRARAAEERLVMQQLGSGVGKSYTAAIADGAGSLGGRLAASLRNLLGGAASDAAKESRKLFVLPGPNPGLAQAGNIDLLHRKVAQLKDAIATVHSFSIGTDKGETLLPQVLDGKLVSIRRAIVEFKKTGQNLGTFDTAAHANDYAERLHREQAVVYAKAIRQARAGGTATGHAYSEGVAAGIADQARGGVDAVAKLLGLLIDHGKDSIGARSPSEVARTGIGHAISDGIALGILDRNGAVVNVLTNQVNDAITAGVQAVRDAVNSAKQNLNSIGSSLAGDISTLLGKRGATPGQPTGAQAARLKELLDRIHSGTADTETIKLAQQLSNQAVAKQSIQQQTGTNQADAVARKIADLTEHLNRGDIKSERVFDARLAAILRSAGISGKAGDKALGIAFGDQLRADIQGLKEQARALLASPKVPGTGLEPTIVRPLETIRDQQRSIADAAANQRSQQLSEAKKANKHLADISAHTKGTATIADINRWIKNAEAHPKAAVDALVAASNRHGR